ncbi:MAG: CBU_0592 family membrane protein [Pyrinomonadaceae bacterium]
MTYAWYDILGTIGVGIIVLTYILLQLERIHSGQLVFSLLNAAGAALISLFHCFTVSTCRLSSSKSFGC